MKIERFHFPLKDKGYQNHIKDSAVIISDSIRLVLEEGKKPFLKVIALQLRLLLCDADPLILRGGNTNLMLAPITNDVNNYGSLAKGTNPTNLFAETERNLQLSDWLEQVVMTFNNPIRLPKEIICQECKTAVDVEQESFGMSIDITDKVILKYKCKCINKFRDYNITRDVETEESTFELEVPIDYTLKSIIKNYSNRYGGAHVQEKVKYDNFTSIHLTENYIVPLGLYILSELLVERQS